MRVPTRRSEIARQALRKDDHYVTQEGVGRMRNDLKRLEMIERPLAAEEVHRTKQMGDLSENAAYQEAKFHLRRINDRITLLQERLKHAILIESGADADGRIRVGSTVTILAGEKKMMFQILGSQETSPGKGRISHLSPLGAALLGHKKGERVNIKTGKGEVEYEILDVT